MKILLYSEYFMPIPGGVQSIVLELAAGLAGWSSQHPGETPIDVTVVTRTTETTTEDASLPFRLLRRPKFWRLVRLLRKADVVHLAGPALLPLAISLAFRKALVVEHHGFQAACPTGLLFYEPEQSACPGYFMARQYGKCMKCQEVEKSAFSSFRDILTTKIRRMLSNWASMNIMPTAWLGTVLKLKRMRTVHHGISSGAEAVSARSNPSTFAYHGRIVSTKGIAVLICAAKKLKARGCQFHLKIIGDGNELATLKSMSSSLSDSVEFLGHVPGEKLDEALLDVSTVVMPSLGGEVFGLVAAENMLRGKLLIVSDLGALQEVTGDTGLSFRTGDPEDLVRCMQEVLDQPSMPASLGAAGHSRVKRLFDRKTMIQKHVRVYQEAISIERTRA
jgi:glycosyltransferase involved in cell wall biosynthesis